MSEQLTDQLGNVANFNDDPREQLLTIFGEEILSAIETGSHDLDRVSQILQTPNPFINDRPSEIDLSSLNPENQERIINYKTFRRSLDAFERDKEIRQTLTRSRLYPHAT